MVNCRAGSSSTKSSFGIRVVPPRRIAAAPARSRNRRRVEAGPGAGWAAPLDPPAMLFHYLLHDGQTDPRARLSGVFRFLRAIELLKSPFGKRVGREAGHPKPFFRPGIPSDNTH